MTPEADPQLRFDWEGSPAPDPAMAVAQPIEGPPRRAAPRLMALALAAAIAGGALAVALSSGGADYRPQPAVSPPAGDVINAAQTPSTPAQAPSAPAPSPSSPPAGTPSSGSANAQPAE